MEKEYTRRLEKIEVVLDSWLPETPNSAWMKLAFELFPFGTSQGPLVTPELAASLTRPGRDLLSRGGKRWRPLLMLLAAESVAGESGAEAALPLTPLVEFPHNASLIHDDIEDNSDERRGKQAVHLIYGTDTAINSGSFMYFLPLACLSAWESPANETNKATLNERLLDNLKDYVWTAWASHMRALHLGQAIDIAWHSDHHALPGLDEYDRMCRLKTGCLARLAAVLGVYIGTFANVKGDRHISDSPDEIACKKRTIKTLADFFGDAAEQLGVGFQILDDVKNLDKGVPGKKRGDDIVEGKKSLPVLLYLHRYPEKRDFAASCFAAARSKGVEAPELEEFIGALQGAGVLEEAREKGLEYIRESRKVFSAPDAAGFPLRKEACSLLAGLVDLLG